LTSSFLLLTDDFFTSTAVVSFTISAANPGIKETESSKPVNSDFDLAFVMMKYLAKVI